MVSPVSWEFNLSHCHSSRYCSCFHIVNQFMAATCTPHYIIVLYIFHYVKGTISMDYQMFSYKILFLLSLGKVRNNPLPPNQVSSQNIELLKTPHRVNLATMNTWRYGCNSPSTTPPPCCNSKSVIDINYSQWCLSWMHQSYRNRLSFYTSTSCKSHGSSS